MSLFSFFKRKPKDAPPAPVTPAAPPVAIPPEIPGTFSSISTANAAPAAAENAAEKPRLSWVEKLKTGLKKTSSALSQVFTGQKIDDELFEQLEEALLLSDAGTAATAHLLQVVQAKVKEEKPDSPYQIQGYLITAFWDLLRPLERPLEIGQHQPTVMMIAGVNGAGKTTTIGKLTKHLSDAGQSVMLAAGDTFRAAAREQLEVWADRNSVEIISQSGGDPAAVSFDAVAAGKARGKDVVMIDTAGRLPTQLHLMEEIKKVKRVMAKADASAPHEVLLVIDGNTGQNALAQVKAFDEALDLTGLVITKLDGTAKGGVLAAIAIWAGERNKRKPQLPPLAVYFIGVGEAIEDLQTFRANEFAQAMLG
jgi:fused signal recognition particle receptor